MERNTNARNFGLYSRNMTKAALNAMRERAVSFNTQYTTVDRFSRFATYLRGEHGIKDMRWIESAHVVAYADHLAPQVDSGTLAQNTAVNYLSAANTVLAQARGDRAVWVSPAHTLGTRSQVAETSRAPSGEALVAAREALIAHGELGVRIDALVGLSNAFGHRFEEAALFNPRDALRGVEQGAKCIDIQRGTKGGRDRTVPISAERQIEALHHAAAVQGNGRSLIPLDRNYTQFRTAAYHLIATTPLSGFHGLRHGYAQARYETLVGTPCPVVAGVRHGRAHEEFIAKELDISREAARDLDHQARQSIAEELGHGRIAITNNYLG